MLRGGRFVLDGCEYRYIRYELQPVRHPPGLTAAETEIVALVLRGATSSEIARERRVSARTIANQLASIYRKLGVNSRAELVYALTVEGVRRNERNLCG